MQAMNDDLQQKKSFYEVEDSGAIIDATLQAISVKLVNCDDSIPAEKRAFNIETLSVSISALDDGFTELIFQKDLVTIDKIYFVQEPELETLTAFQPQKAFIKQLAASDSVQYAYLPILGEGDLTNGITITAVAIGQMPQGCEIEVDAVAEFEFELVN